MFGFGNKKEDSKLESILRESRMAFDFDKSGVKNRLMMSIETAQRRTHIERRFGFKFAVGTCLVVLATLSGTFVYADSAKPGDKLYFLDLFEEKIYQSLPASAASKAELSSNLVLERLEELDELPQTEETKLQRTKTLEKAQVQILETVNKAAEAKRNLREDQKKKLEQVNQVLERMEKAAEEQEKKIEQDKTDSKDSDDNERYQQRLEDIKKARTRARTEKESESYRDSRQKDTSRTRWFQNFRR